MEASEITAKTRKKRNRSGRKYMGKTATYTICRRRAKERQKEKETERTVSTSMERVYSATNMDTGSETADHTQHTYRKEENLKVKEKGSKKDTKEEGTKKDMTKDMEKEEKERADMQTSWEEKIDTHQHPYH